MILIFTGTKKEIDKFKAQMEEKFEMSDLGLLAYYLGIEVTQTEGDISIRQSAYAIKILKEAGMIDCNETLIPMDPGTRLTKITEGTMVNSTEYRSLIGCLRYLLHTRPDLSYSVGLLSRFMQEPREQHMKAIRQVLRYVKGTKDYGITYKHNGGNKIYGYSDSSYGVNTQEGKGTTGIIFYYGESPISWSTQKQATVALSSCESKFIAATATVTQALWLKRLLSKLTHSQEEKVTIQVDNKSAIALMKNPVFHGRSKHIDTKYHFIRECVEREDIQVEFIFDPTRLESASMYDFVSLDSRIPSRIYPLPFTFNFRPNLKIRFSILESYNGLLLCECVNKHDRILEDRYYIYNPSVNLFKMLPKCHDPSLTMVRPDMKLAFDPRKSHHYKVVLIGILDGFEKIEIYSSETGSWSVCRIPNKSHIYFQSGIYSNNAIHWLDYENEPLHFKLDILNELPIITKIQLPITMDKKKAWDRKLFECRGCLLLLGVDYANSQQFNVYEMNNVSSEWPVKYNLNLDDSIISWPKTINGNVWCIVLGEREEDASIVMNLDKKVVEYKIMSKNLHELYDIGSGLALYSFQFFASFAGV
ncbi:ribonuclease H-like domain, reverse transcriptase, RNA-dependent DNA polymerase [Tanacetum coccineum]